MPPMLLLLLLPAVGTAAAVSVDADPIAVS